MIEIILSAAYFLIIVFLIYISFARIKPTIEKYTDIEMHKIKTLDSYKLFYVEYRKICKKNGLSLLYSNMFIAAHVFALVILLLWISRF
jgi:hypothetical protein